MIPFEPSIPTLFQYAILTHIAVKLKAIPNYKTQDVAQVI